jgi:hypothetical protein
MGRNEDRHTRRCEQRDPGQPRDRCFCGAVHRKEEERCAARYADGQLPSEREKHGPSSPGVQSAGRRQEPERQRGGAEQPDRYHDRNDALGAAADWRLVKLSVTSGQRQ